MRVLLLCWSGDHPGQCEIGKFLNQGKCACRRCKLIGQKSDRSTHYYYGNNRYHCRYPWGNRDIQLEQDNLFDLDNETRKSMRKKQSSDKGFTGTSLLHKYLYPLYGFDILHHMVIDIFHTVLLNVCRNQLQRVLELELLDTSYLDEERINIKVEESQGFEMCTISLHNMIHVHEDIMNFSATDNYWCAVFERAVKDYVKRSQNCKGVEAQEKKTKSQNWVNVGNFLVNSIIPKKIPNLVKSSIPNFSLSLEYEFTKVFPR